MPANGRQREWRRESDRAVTLGGQKKFQDAEAATRRAIQLVEDAIAQAPDRPELPHELAFQIHGLASIAQDAKRSDEAETLYRRAIAAREPTSGLAA